MGGGRRKDSGQSGLNSSLYDNTGLGLEPALAESLTSGSSGTGTTKTGSTVRTVNWLLPPTNASPRRSADLRSNAVDSDHLDLDHHMTESVQVLLPPLPPLPPRLDGCLVVKTDI